MDAFVFDVSMSEASDGEEIQPIKVRPLLSVNFEEGQDNDEEVAVVRFDKIVFNKMEFIVRVNQIYEVPHPLQTINVQHSERL